MPYTPPVLLKDVVNSGAIPYTNPDGTLSNIADTYTQELLIFKPTTTDFNGRALTSTSVVDNILLIKYGTQYFARQYQGPIKMEWFGITPSLPCDTAWNKFLLAVPEPPNMNVHVVGTSVYPDSPSAAVTEWPNGTYIWTGAIEMGYREISMICSSGVTHHVCLNGANLGNDSYGRPRAFLWLRADTGRGTAEIRNMVFDGMLGIDSRWVPESTNPSNNPDDYNPYTGIRVNAVWHFTNVVSQQWKGHGWWFGGNISYKTNLISPIGWNASRCRLDSCGGASCGGASFYVGGTDPLVAGTKNLIYDANQILFLGRDSRDCRWGLYDTSFLGIQDFGGHGNANPQGHLVVDSNNSASVVYGCYEEDGDAQLISRINGRTRATGRFTNNGPAVNSDIAASIVGDRISKVVSPYLLITSNVVNSAYGGLAFNTLSQPYSMHLSQSNYPPETLVHIGWSRNIGQDFTFELMEANALLRPTAGDIVRANKPGAPAVPLGFFAGNRHQAWFLEWARVSDDPNYLWWVGDVLHCATRPGTVTNFSSPRPNPPANRTFSPETFYSTVRCVKAGTISGAFFSPVTGIITQGGSSSLHISSRSLTRVLVGSSIQMMGTSSGNNITYEAIVSSVSDDPNNANGAIWAINVYLRAGIAPNSGQPITQDTYNLAFSKVVFQPVGDGRGLLASRPDIVDLAANNVDPTGWRYFATDTNTWYTATPITTANPNGLWI